MNVGLSSRGDGRPRLSWRDAVAPEWRRASPACPAGGGWAYVISA